MLPPFSRTPEENAVLGRAIREALPAVRQAAERLAQLGLYIAPTEQRNEHLPARSLSAELLNYADCMEAHATAIAAELDKQAAKIQPNATA